jgi:putative RecB family exonuclease
MTSNATTPTHEPATGLRALPDPGGNEEVLQYLSASRLKCWASCRRQFFYRYVERIKTPTAPALFLGQAVHELLRLHNWRRWKGEVHEPVQLRKELDSWWAREAPKARVAWKAPEDEDKTRKQAWSLVETYLEQQNSDSSERTEGVEVRVDCDFGRGIPPLIGIIDLVQSGVIIDYKTAARSPDAVMAAHQHITQLCCYALLFRQATGRRENGFELHHLIKTKQPKIVIHHLAPMTPAQEAQLFFLIDDYLDGIANERWIPSPGQHCAWCDYADRCRSQSGIG